MAGVFLFLLVVANPKPDKQSPWTPQSQIAKSHSRSGDTESWARRQLPPLKREVPRPGQIITANRSYVPALCIDTKEGLSEAIRWVNRRDMEEVARVMLRHGGQLINAGDQLKVLDPGFMTTAKVRVLSTERECYTIAEVTR